MQLQAAGLWPIQPLPKYIEDVFSTYLYTGNGSTQTIVNGINLSTNGGMVWFKNRSNAFPGNIFDTVRNNGYLTTTSTGAVNAAGGGVPPSSGIASFNNNGFTIADGSAYWNSNSQTYASWTFREQSKFFDIVTYTGNGSNPRTISHNLGSTPGCIIFKSVSDAGYGWVTWHRSLNANGALQLQETTAEIIDANLWGGSPTDTTFSVSSYSGQNVNGIQYVAYVFAHNAGGFGLTGTDNVISCGSVTLDGSGQGSVNLGYEPQWILYKRTDGLGNWSLVDSMRGWLAEPNQSGATLLANTNNYEAQLGGQGSPASYPNSTGFLISGSAGQSFIYVVIRRGPMKVPTVGTSVYQAVTRTGNSPTVNSITSVGFPPDSIWQKRVSGSTAASNVFDRLRGRYLLSPRYTDGETAADTSETRDLISFNMTGFSVGEQYSSELNANTRPEVYWNFGRAPNFFDEVCYTGTGSATTFSHNLTVVPEMMIVKRRSGGGEWTVYHSAMGNTKRIFFDTAAEATGTMWNNTTPTSSVFSVGTDYQVNLSASTYVAYLFATCSGVSKVGSYTGTGALLTVNCGFTSGARFILIKRTDSTGDWYVYDSARGISSGDDPYLLLNSTAVEVTGTNYVDTTSVGFQVTAAAPAGLNASGGTYIFLAIA
jgi:hypothetical protein